MDKSAHKMPAPALSSNNSRYFIQALESLGKQFNFSLDLPFIDLNDVQSIILYGSAKVPVIMEFDDGMRSYRTKNHLKVIPNLARRYRETNPSWTREELENTAQISLVMSWRQTSKGRGIC